MMGNRRTRNAGRRPRRRRGLGRATHLRSLRGRVGRRLRRDGHVPLRVHHQHQRDGDLRAHDRAAEAQHEAAPHVRAARRPRVRPSSSKGCVAWVNCVRENGDNPNPGMGIRFVNLQPDERERLVEVIRTIAYLREARASSSPSVARLRYSDRLKRGSRGYSLGSGKRRATMPAPGAVLSSHAMATNGPEPSATTAGFARVRPSTRLAWNSLD